LSDVVLHGTASYSNPPTNAAGLYLSAQLGGDVAEGLAIAVYLDIDGAGANNSGGTLTLVSLGLSADWHPVKDAGWRVGAKVGTGGIMLDPNASQPGASGDDFACSLLGGYDWKLSSRWAVGLVGRIAYYSTTDLEFPAATEGTIGNGGPTGPAVTSPAESFRLSAVAYSLAFSALF
jgi:hypothetical protein